MMDILELEKISLNSGFTDAADCVSLIREHYKKQVLEKVVLQNAIAEIEVKVEAGLTSLRAVEAQLKRYDIQLKEVEDEMTHLRKVYDRFYRHINEIYHAEVSKGGKDIFDVGKRVGIEKFEKTLMKRTAVADRKKYNLRPAEMLKGVIAAQFKIHEFEIVRQKLKTVGALSRLFWNKKGARALNRSERKYLKEAMNLFWNQQSKRTNTSHPKA